MWGKISELCIKGEPGGGWMWWCMPSVPVLGRQRQQGLFIWGHPGLCSKFPDSQSYTERPCLNKEKKETLVVCVYCVRWVLSPFSWVTGTLFHDGTEEFKRKVRKVVVSSPESAGDKLPAAECQTTEWPWQGDRQCSLGVLGLSSSKKGG